MRAWEWQAEPVRDIYLAPLFQHLSTMLVKMTMDSHEVSKSVIMNEGDQDLRNAIKSIWQTEDTWYISMVALTLLDDRIQFTIPWRTIYIYIYIYIVIENILVHLDPIISFQFSAFLFTSPGHRRRPAAASFEDPKVAEDADVCAAFLDGDPAEHLGSRCFLCVWIYDDPLNYCWSWYDIYIYTHTLLDFRV